jgi:beta-lactamase class A
VAVLASAWNHQSHVGTGAKQSDRNCFARDRRAVLVGILKKSDFTDAVNSPTARQFGKIAPVGDDLDDLFEGAGCTGALHVIRVSDAAEVALRADEPWLAASVIKVPIALEFYAQVGQGLLDAMAAVTLEAASRTPGPTGISVAVDPVTMSLRDLCGAMLAISDNAATDVVLESVGKEAVNQRLKRLGCASTRLVESISGSIDAMARDLGFADYSTLLRAQAGALGSEAQAASLDQERIGSSRVLDPARASCTTARDMTRLLSAIWTDRAASPGACAEVRKAMVLQLTKRLATAVPPGGSLAAKTGSLFGRVRNEVAAITTPTGETYAVAVLTRPHRPFDRIPEIDQVMGLAVKAAIEHLEARPR